MPSAPGNRRGGAGGGGAPSHAPCYRGEPRCECDRRALQIPALLWATSGKLGVPVGVEQICSVVERNMEVTGGGGGVYGG